MIPFLIAALWPVLSSAYVIQAQGPRTFQPLLEDWVFAFSQEKPEVSWKFTSRTTISSVISSVGLNSTWDFGLLDFQTPSDIDYVNYPNIQIIPFVVSTLVPQVYLPGSRVVYLHPEDLAQIYLGNITKWNDPRIVATNPNMTLGNITIPFPDTQIKVWVRSGSSIFNTFWTAALSAWSPEWASRYGISSVFPISSTNQSGNFYAASSDLRMNGAVLSTLYSIGYTSYAEVAREETITYVHLYNDYGATLNVTTNTMTESVLDAPIDELLRSNFSVNPSDPDAWPIASYAYMVIPANFNDSCEDHRTFMKFIKWAISSSSPRLRTTQSGYAPIPEHVLPRILTALKGITCQGKPMMEYNDVDYDLRRGSIFILFFMISVLILLGGMFLSFVHVRHFSHTRINLIYSIVFVIGATLTLLAPLFWFFTPDKQYICNARLWTTTLGFTVLLGTMFSRTWQLRDIYLLQKKKLETLKYRTSARSSIIKLATTLTLLMTIQLIILAIWQSSDPLRSDFFISNELEFEAFYRCTSNSYHWFIIQLMFFLSLLVFGVYVIYQTWSFQRKALLIETRWVLLALYNIVLTLFAITPLFSLLEVTDAFVSLIAVIAIDLSGGGIVAAVLLPRVLDKLEWSTHTHSRSGGKHDTAMSASPPRPENASKGGSKGGRKPSHQKAEISRTPEGELALRLEEPQPLRAFRKQDRTDRDPIIFEESTGLPSTKDTLIELPSLRRNERRPESPMEESMSAIPEQTSPSDRSPVQTPTPNTGRNSQLHWNENPISSTKEKTTTLLLAPDLDVSSASHVHE